MTGSGITGAQSARNPNSKFLKIIFLSRPIKKRLFINNSLLFLKGSNRCDNGTSPKPVNLFKVELAVNS